MTVSHASARPARNVTTRSGPDTAIRPGPDAAVRPRRGRRPAPRPVPRPTLLPGLRRLWRGRHSLQLGIDPARAVVLELPDAGVARMLDLLDGTRSERTVLDEAGQLGIPAEAARALLDSLYAAGLVVGAQCLLPNTLPKPVRQRLTGEAVALALRAREPVGTAGGASATPAQILRRRAAAGVAVSGLGPLATPVALALAQAGVGHIWPVRDDPTATALAQVAPGTRTTPLPRRETTLVVQGGATGPAALAAAGYSPRRVANLVVAVRDGTPVIGPLVPPRGRPCLGCLDRHRTDRDPQWPVVAAQLATVPEEPCAAATVLAAAGLAAGEALAWLDGATPGTVGASIEVSGPGQLRRRSWPPHPGCHCAGSGTMAR